MPMLKNRGGDGLLIVVRHDGISSLEIVESR